MKCSDSNLTNSDSHIHEVPGTLKSVGHLFFNAAPLAEDAAVIAMDLVYAVDVVH